MRPNHLLVLCLVAACGGSSSNPGSSVDAPAGANADAPPGSIDAPAATGDPAGDGPASVTMSNASIPGKTTGRTLPSTVFVPSSAGPHALVVISPGFQMQRTQYTSYAHHLATWGFVVVLTDYADTGFSADHTKLAQDVPAVIDWALAQQALAVDAQKIATAGHSLGGKISVYAATLDARIKAVVGWDPVDSNSPSVAPEKMTTMTAAVAVVGETTDGSGGFMPCAPTADNFQTFYAAAPSPALQMTVDNADHMDWVDDHSCAFCSVCTAGTAPDDRAHTATRRLDVAWLRKQLYADAAMDPWLAAPADTTVVRK